jgi:hypothetical protein
MRTMRYRVAAALAAICASTVVLAGPKKAAEEPHGKGTVVDSPVDVSANDEPRQVAEQYLKAIDSSGGDDKGRELLLGGTTMTAAIFTLANWKIVGREPSRRETGDLGDVAARIAAIDKAGAAVIAAIMGGGPLGNGKGDSMSARSLTAEDAAKLQAPTHNLAIQFKESHPVFAYVSRADKSVFWHPKNPIRKVIQDAGGKGSYQLDLNLFRIETVEGLATPTPRVWPLRVLRLKTAKMDTGWRILPASDWNAE